MIQLGIRLHDATEGTLMQRAASVRKQGFVCVHLALSKAVKDFPKGNGALTPGLAMHIRHIFEREGLDIAVLGCYKNLAEPDERLLRQIQSTYYAHIRFASLLGCGVVGTETGAPNHEYRYEISCHSEEALGTFMRHLAPVVRCAEDFGVVLAIEPVWNHIVWNPKRALCVLRTMASENLRIIFDPVNLLSMENYMKRDAVIEEALDLLGEYISVVHIKDFNVDHDKLVSTAAGNGIMDYKRIIRYLKKEKPFIQATLENTSPDNAESARKFIQDVYDDA